MEKFSLPLQGWETFSGAPVQIFIHLIIYKRPRENQALLPCEAEPPPAWPHPWPSHAAQAYQCCSCSMWGPWPSLCCAAVLLYLVCSLSSRLPGTATAWDEMALLPTYSIASPNTAKNSSSQPIVDYQTLFFNCFKCAPLSEILLSPVSTLHLCPRIVTSWGQRWSFTQKNTKGFLCCCAG
jgi:hypothetical protein